jgi:hypothetical protein
MMATEHSDDLIDSSLSGRPSNTTASSSIGGATINKPTKHGLDWVLAGFALVSLTINIFQFVYKRRETIIAQAPPEISRTIMTVRDARIFYGLRERKDLLFQTFPSPGFISTQEWERALRNADERMTELELERSEWRFLTLRSVGNLTFKQIEVKSGNVVLAAVSGLSPQQTLFLYYPSEDYLKNVRVSYQIQGDSAIADANVPPQSPNVIVPTTELPGIKIASLQGVDDRTRQLIQSKNNALPH